MNEEIGLRQEGPTVLYQDNQSAIQIAMNRGSLSKKTRAMEVRTLTLRNKVEDMKVVPIWVETDKMLADLGTKTLDPKQVMVLKVSSMTRGKTCPLTIVVEKLVFFKI